jgi:hypothetical protein
MIQDMLTRIVCKLSIKIVIKVSQILIAFTRAHVSESIVRTNYASLASKHYK